MNMTLEQVRDSLREYEKTGHVFNAKSLADAIDAHLAKAGKPVAWLVENVDVDGPHWPRVRSVFLSEQDALNMAQRYPKNQLSRAVEGSIMPLYTQPYAQEAAAPAPGKDDGTC